MPSPLALVWDLIAKDSASPAFLRVAGAADRAAGSTLRAQKGVEGAAAGMSRVGAKLTKGLTVPLLGLAAVSVDQAAKYQKALNTVAVATDKTAAQTAQAGKGLESIAKSTGTSLSQLTDSYYTAAKSGKSVADSLAIVKAASQGAKAEGADLGTVTDALTSIMASYGKSLGSPVQAMNAIIKGAGLAKTNIGDFSSSLSNVVPIASALHISFAQVAGAIDTMTQHGETAQRATDNLSNLITNLAGQNNVASKSLQALGVNTVDLSKNLGRRGLTGSLNTVLTAIAKHGKDGLIVTSAFKQSATATSGLRAELDAMPPALKAQSEAFDKGSLSYKDYNAYVKSLGGQQYQLGKGFISTEAQAKGFSSQLTSGNSTVRTLASTLQRALGGVTGMRTALMLSGESASTFAADTAAVGAASKRAGGDVLGWSTTQGTLAVKIDKAKESLQVMAVEIGTALLPAVSKIVGAVSKAVGWFDSLSSGDKKFLGWSAVVLAAIGPVLSIFGRVVTLLRVLPGLFARAGESAALSGTRIGAGLATTGKVVAGVQGGAIGGYLGSSLVAGHVNGSSVTGAVGTVLGGAAGGAALGAVGGPVGAAIGGVAGAAVGAVTAFHHMGDAAQNAAKVAKAALDDQKAAAADLLTTLQSVAGAYNQQYRQNVTQKLDSAGALSIGNKAGLQAGALTNAVIGVGGPKALAGLNAQLENAAAAGKISFTQLAKVQGVIQQLAPAASNAEGALERQNRELGKGELAANQVGTSYAKLKAAFAGTGAALDTGSAAGKRNNAIFIQNVAAVNAAAAAQLKAKVPTQQVAAAYIKQIAALSDNSVALGANRADVDALVSKYANVPKSVITAIEQRGIATLSPELISVLGLYKQWPKSKSTTVGVHDNASGPLTNIHDLVNNLHSKTITVTTYSRLVSTAAGSTPSGNSPNGTVGGGIIIGQHAAGGTIRGRGTGTSDSNLIWASKGEEVINAKQSMKHRGLLKAINAGVAGFATGGTVGVGRFAARFAKGGSVGGQSLMAAIEAAGFKGRAAEIMYAIVMAESGGNARAHNGNAGTGDNSYGLAQINMLGSMGPARRRQYGLSSNSQLFDPATNLSIAYKMSHGGTKFSDWSTYNRGDYEKFLGQSGAKISNGGKGGGSLMGPDGQTYASARAAANALVRAQNTLAKELPKFTKAIGGTTDQLKSAETTLLNDVKAVGASSKVLAKVQKDFRRLNSLAATRDSLQAQLGSPTKNTTTAYDQLAIDKQAFADQAKSVSDAITSGFNILTAGQPADSAAGGPSPAFQSALARYQAGRQEVDDDAILGAGDGTDSSTSSAYSVTGALGSLDSQIAAARKFKAQLATLQKEGLNTSLYGQLAGEGVAGAGQQVDALASASAAQIKALSSKYSTLLGIGGATGTDVARVVDGAAVTRDEGVIRTLQTELAADRAAMAAQTRAIVDAIHGIGGDLGDTLNGAAGKAKNKARGIRAGHSGAFG